MRVLSPTAEKSDSQSSTSSIVEEMEKQLNTQSQEILDEKMPDVDKGDPKKKTSRSYR
ncbi:hypothetical protein Glove_27g19 [Diversispora epigaea]|uniref:Uncharacterized protein n=1 Tax=Diversispora epigaea TaxID=1348612 RepID=A0A397JS08_9GLOM|nr:hypothetical protein Glove_27g19 [Diversispora epigaea]